jgi:hypothetical protein
METELQQDIAKEPVDLTTDADFMDTGVLHEDRICSNCGDAAAARGFRMCTDCLEKS